MATTDLERMVVSLEASITKYERAMAKAVGETKSTTAKIEKEFGGLEKKLGGMFAAVGRGIGPGLVAGLAGGAAAFLSIEGVINGAADAFERFGQIADLSGRAALDPEFFQAIAFQASQAGVSMETLGGAMATFAKNSALAVEGRGKLASQLEVLNPALLESIRLAQTQEQRFRLVVDALAGVSNEAERIAIASAAFGEAGAGLATAFEGGANELDKMIQKAQDAGIVVDSDLIAKADELGDEWEKNSLIIDTQLKVALMELGPIIVGLTGLAAGFAAQIAAGIAGLKGWGEWIRTHGRPGMLGTPVPGADSRAADGGMFGQRNLDDIWPAGLGSPNAGAGIDTGLTDTIAGATPTIEQFNGASEELFQTVGGDLAPALTTLTDQFTGVGKAAGHGGGGKGGGKGAADGVAELITQLQFEKDLLGQSEVDQDVANALRRAGADATDEQKAAIEALVRSLDAEKTAMDASKESMQEFKNIAQSALSGFISDLRQGKSAAEALGNVLNNLADKMLNKGLDMLLNAAFSSVGFAQGGVAQWGKPLPRFAGGGISSRAAIFGETGVPEAAVPLPNGRQIPVDLRMAGGAAAGPPEMKITVGVAADSMGNLLPFVESVSTRNITRAAPTIIATANKTTPAALAQHQRDIAGSDYRLR